MQNGKIPLLPPVAKLILAKECLRPFLVLEQKRIVHLDIKLSNLIVPPQGRVKAIDTSEALAMGKAKTVSKKPPGINIEESYKLEEYYGRHTPNFFPPEGLKNQYSLKSDVF